MSLFVLSCKDGWVNIMYDGLDAVGVDQQVTVQEMCHDADQLTFIDGSATATQSPMRFILCVLSDVRNRIQFHLRNLTRSADL